MARRRISSSQLRSRLRQAEQKQRQAVNRYNAAVRKYNRERKRTIDQYNREVRAHNARVRSNRQKLKRELTKLQQASNKQTATRYVVYRQSVTTLRRSYERIEASAAAGTWHGGSDLLDLAEGETANSVAALNALLGEPETKVESATDEAAATTSLGSTSSGPNHRSESASRSGGPCREVRSSEFSGANSFARRTAGTPASSRFAEALRDSLENTAASGPVDTSTSPNEESSEFQTRSPPSVMSARAQGSGGRKSRR